MKQLCWMPRSDVEMKNRNKIVLLLLLIFVHILILFILSFLLHLPLNGSFVFLYIFLINIYLSPTCNKRSITSIKEFQKIIGNSNFGVTYYLGDVKYIWMLTECSFLNFFHYFLHKEILVPKNWLYSFFPFVLCILALDFPIW